MDEWLTGLVQFLRENNVEYYKTQDIELKFAPSAFYDKEQIAKVQELTENKTEKELFEQDLFFSAR